MIPQRRPRGVPGVPVVELLARQVFMGTPGRSAGGIWRTSRMVRQEFLLIMSGVFLLEIGSVALQVGY
jgi:hypothetical protein